jgi:uncharacterized membrane protein YphA (DoxX/SURF4 family)
MMDPTTGEDLVSIAALAARVLLGAIFFQAGLQKLRHYGEWQGVVANYRVMSRRLVPVFSGLLPIGELALSAALWLSRDAVVAAVCSAALLLLFSVAIGINLARGRAHIDCGCFQSSLRQNLSGRLLARNGVLAAIAGATAAGGDTASVPMTVIILATSLGGVCFILYLALNELVVQRRPIPALPALRRI